MGFENNSRHSEPSNFSFIGVKVDGVDVLKIRNFNSVKYLSSCVSIEKKKEFLLLSFT